MASSRAIWAIPRPFTAISAAAYWELWSVSGFPIIGKIDEIRGECLVEVAVVKERYIEGIP